MIYLLVINIEEIYNKTIKIFDQDFQTINFQGEEIIDCYYCWSDANFVNDAVAGFV